MTGDYLEQRGWEIPLRFPLGRDVCSCWAWFTKREKFLQDDIPSNNSIDHFGPSFCAFFFRVNIKAKFTPFKEFLELNMVDKGLIEQVKIPV
jgi:hypothetical protein